MLDINNSFSFEKSKLFAEKLDIRYPFLDCLIIGRTSHGRGIFSFSVGSKTNSVLITGGYERPDFQTSPVLYKFIDSVCQSIDTEAKLSGIDFSALVRKFGITVIPSLCPDCLCDKDELRFDCFGETEKRTFLSFCKRHHFRSCLTLKSGSGKIYYSSKSSSPAPSSLMAKILSSSCLYPVSEEEMRHSPSKLFSDAFSKPAFLIEARKGRDNEDLYKKLEETLVLMSLM